MKILELTNVSILHPGQYVLNPRDLRAAIQERPLSERRPLPVPCHRFRHHRPLRHYSRHHRLLWPCDDCCSLLSSDDGFVVRDGGGLLVYAGGAVVAGGAGGGGDSTTAVSGGGDHHIVHRTNAVLAVCSD